MKNNPLISIIVPVYNVEKYLPKCLETIINQTYRNLDIIVIIDGSSDNCLQIANEFQKNDNRITVIYQDNKGLSGARNSGLKVAKGDYYFFVDSDDYLSLNAIELFVNKFNEDDFKIVMAKRSDVKDGNIIPKNKTYKNSYSAMECQNILNSCDTVFITVWNKLYKKELFNDLYFSEGKINEDEAIMHHLYGLQGQIGFINEDTYFTLHREDSIMYSSSYSRFFDGYYHAFLDRYHYYITNNQKQLSKQAMRRLYGCTYDFLNHSNRMTNNEKQWVLNVIKITFKHLDIRSIKLSLKFITFKKS